MKRIVMLFLCFLVLLSGCADASLQETTAPTAPTASDISFEDTALYQSLLSELTLDTDVVSLECQGDLLRIETIMPGLNTYDLTITTASLSQERILGSVALGEDAWQTGWTEDGFYVVSLTKRVVTLYDETCREVRSVALPEEADIIHLAMPDNEGDTILFGDAFTGIYYVYDVQSGETHDVHQLSGYHRPIGYSENSFFLYNDDGAVCIHETVGYATAPYSDRRVRLPLSDRGIGVTDTGFCIVTANTDAVRYLTAFEESEVLLSAVEDGFVTVAAQKQGDTVRVYDIAEAKCYQATMPFSVVQAHRADDELLCLVRRQERFFLYRCDLSAFDRAQITVSTVERKPNEPTDDRGFDTPLYEDRVIDVEPMAQMPAYPTGCESISAVMALRFAGCDITPEEFIDGYLPQDFEFYYEDGVCYGPDPYATFVGYPEWDTSYGCMAPVIESAATAYLGSSDRVINTTGSSLRELCARYIDNDLPVLVWGTIGMEETYPTASWILPSGEQFYWPANEHCMLLIGYDDTYYYVNDPCTGQRERYLQWIFEARYADLGSQSLVITKD